MNKFGVCLDYRHLQHLILSDKAGYDALQSVALFLLNNMNDNSIFNISKQKPTFDLADKYAKKHLMRDWQEEKRDSEVRVNEHWNEVLSKKKLASKLRSELKELTSELITAENNVDIAREEFDSKNTWTNRRNRYYLIRSLQEELESCERKVANLENQIDVLKEEIEGKR